MNHFSLTNWPDAKIYEFIYDPSLDYDRRYEIYDVVYATDEIPSHKRSHRDRNEQSFAAKRDMIRKALRK